MAIDLKQLKTEDQGVLELYDHKGEPMGIRLMLAGPYSQQALDSQKTSEKKRQNFFRQLGSVRKMSAGQQKEFDEMIQKLMEDRIVNSVLAWEHAEDVDSPEWEAGVPYGGELLGCNKENVSMVFKELPYLKDQVFIFISNEANFTGVS